MSQWDETDAFEAAQPAISLSQRALGFGSARAAPYLDDLNPAQRQAVEALDGPVLMLAGAGTGKTKALITRIVHLMQMGRARPFDILAVTFTNKAAREMRKRIAVHLGDGAEGMSWMGTFHSLSVKILRRHAELVGLKSSFTILDTDDQLRLLRQVINAANIDEKRWPARALAGIIDGWKNKALTPEKVPSSEASAFNNRGTELYEAYQNRLIALNACDFGDLLMHCVTLFQARPDILQEYQRRFKYILVDEYQDTNVAQYMWLRLLAQGHKNICCVGDDDQSIYGWRGAEVGNILRFEKDFPGAVVVRLEQNYRSTPHILAAASSVIAKNEDRLCKTLWTDAQTGDKVQLIGHWDGEEEARSVGEKIIEHQLGRSVEARHRFNPRSTSQQQETDRRHKSPISLNPYGDIHEVNLMRSQVLSEAGPSNLPLPTVYSLDEMAILVRASHQMRAFEDRFLTIGLPYRVIGGPRFYERQEIRDAMAYFRLAVSPTDDLAFERVVNTPKRGLGDKAMQGIQIEARAVGMSLLEGARSLLGKSGIGGKGAGQLRAFVEGVDRWHRATQGRRPPVVGGGVGGSEGGVVPGNGEAWTVLEPLDGDTVIDAVLLDDDDLIRLGRPQAKYDHVRLAEVILEESGYTAMWQNDKTPEAAGRLENLKELVKALEGFDSLQGFLEHVSLIMDNDADAAEEKVTIMTLHAAKGLEFPVVFLPGWEEGLFPSQRSMDESGKKGLEEERRLAYVGITRAEELCTISFASNRRVYGKWQSQLPSRFIDELPVDHVDVMTPPSLYGGGYGAAAPSSGASQIDERVSRADVYNSPGWRRLQTNSAARVTTAPTRQPREARGLTIDASALSSYVTGDRVFHQKFGYGEVMGIEGDKLEIEFDHAGPRNVVATWVIPAHHAADPPF